MPHVRVGDSLRACPSAHCGRFSSQGPRSTRRASACHVSHARRGDRRDCWQRSCLALHDGQCDLLAVHVIRPAALVHLRAHAARRDEPGACAAQHDGAQSGETVRGAQLQSSAPPCASGRFSSRSTQLYSARARALVMRHCPGVEPAAPTQHWAENFRGGPQGACSWEAWRWRTRRGRSPFRVPGGTCDGVRRGGPVVTRHPDVAADRSPPLAAAVAVAAAPTVGGRGRADGRAGGRAGGGRRTAGGGRGRQFF